MSMRQSRILCYAQHLHQHDPGRAPSSLAKVVAFGCWNQPSTPWPAMDYFRFAVRGSYRDDAHAKHRGRHARRDGVGQAADLAVQDGGGGGAGGAGGARSSTKVGGASTAAALAGVSVGRAGESGSTTGCGIAARTASAFSRRSADFCSATCRSTLPAPMGAQKANAMPRTRPMTGRMVTSALLKWMTPNKMRSIARNTKPKNPENAPRIGRPLAFMDGAPTLS